MKTLRKSQYLWLKMLNEHRKSPEKTITISDEEYEELITLGKHIDIYNETEEEHDYSDTLTNNQVEGSYTGNEVVIVSLEESSNDTKTYEFTKVSDTSINMTVPEIGTGGMMTIPSFQVNGITITKDVNNIKGNITMYEGVINGEDDSTKTYVISDLIAIFNDNMVAITYSMRYGNMPFVMKITFTGTRK